KILRWPTRVLLVLMGAVCGFAPVTQKPLRDPAEQKIVRVDDIKGDSRVMSFVILDEPIYACSETVFVRGYVPGADIQVFSAGYPSPVGQGRSMFSSTAIRVMSPLVKGQVLTAKQTFGGFTSGSSNTVTVRDWKDDYPNGIPKPRMEPPPLFPCGR